MRIAVVLAVFLLSGCGWSPMRYAPQVVEDRAVALKQLDELLRERAFETVQVLPDRFVTERGVVDFDQIAIVSLHSGLFSKVAVLKSSSREVIFRYRSTDGDEVRRFADAIETIRRGV